MPTRKLFAALLVIVTAGAPALAADRFAIDPDHTYPSVENSHMGLSVFRGKFNKTTGTVTLDRAARTGAVDILVDTSSVDFGHEEVNKHLQSEEFFNVAKYPTASYKGTLVFSRDTPQFIDGRLTLLGVTRPVKLKINSFKCIMHPYYKKEVCGADAEGEINRADFGMTKGIEWETGKARLRIQVEALKVEAGNARR